MPEKKQSIPNILIQPLASNGHILEYDIPRQDKGLREDEGDELMHQAYADGYGQYVDELRDEWVEMQVRELSSHLNGKGLRVVEMGGGYGIFFERIKDVVRDYFNVEPSLLEDECGLYARSAGKDYWHLQATAENIPIRDHEIDVVLSIASLDHIPNLQQAMSEVNRVLKPSGIFIFTINNRRSWWKMLLSKTKYLRAREEIIKKDHYILWNPAQAHANISKFLSIQKIETISYMPQLPLVWKLLAPYINRLGRRVAPTLGGNIVGVYTAK